MRSTIKYCSFILLSFCLGFISISAQNRVQKLYSRSLMNGNSKSDPTKKIYLNISGKDHQPLKDSYVRVDGTTLEFEANEDGLISIELPSTWKEDEVTVHVSGKNHRAKTLIISLYDIYEVSRSVNLKYRTFRSTICPSF